MGRLAEFFFKSLPDYFFVYDSYKRDDIEYVEGSLVIKGFTDRDYGLLERYLWAFQYDAGIIDKQIAERIKAHYDDYLEDPTKPQEVKQLYIEEEWVGGLLHLPFPLATIPEHLTFVAGLYGYPPDAFPDISVNNVSLYRSLLSNIVSVNKVKGTKEGFKRFFKTFGVEITVTRRYMTPIFYDDGSKYDEADTFYDAGCFPCTYVSMDITADYWHLFEPTPTYSENQKKGIQSILKYLLPINAIVDEDNTNAGLDAWNYLAMGPQGIQLSESENLIKFKRIA